MAAEDENICDFLLTNTTDPVIIFDTRNFRIIMLNRKAELLIQPGDETDMKAIFSTELLNGIIDNLEVIKPETIFRNYKFFKGYVHYSAFGQTGILLIKAAEEDVITRIVEGIKYPIAFFDVRGILIYWNDKAAVLLGYAPMEIIGKTVSEILTFLSPGSEVNYHFKSFREGVGKFRSKSGRLITLEISNSLVKNKKGAVSGVLCMMKDISERETIDNYMSLLYRKHIAAGEQNESELQLSESRFRMLFEQSPLIIQIFNAEGYLLKYNNCFKKTWEASDELLKNYNLFNDNSIKESDFFSYMERAQRGEFSEIQPVKYFPAFAEHYIWMRGFIYPVRNSNDSIREIVLILENITDQKKIEESFGIEASYRNAIESSVSAGIAVVDFNGRQTYVNDAFCKMVGWSKEELTGIYPPFIYWSEEGKADIENAFNETLSGNAPSSGFELKFKKKNNEVFDVLVIINPLKTMDGSIQGWLASVSDISKLKTVEKEIKHSLREKEVLLQEIHHRVKNNLQIISSLLNLQLNYIQNKEMQEIFKESQNRVMSMALIHQKLYLSKDQLSIDLQEYINELIQHLMKSYNISKSIDVDVQVNNVSLDNDKVVILGLIVNELISNALRYAFPDGRRGNIKVHMNNTSSGISLVVKDDGKGLPENLNYRKTNSLGLQLVNTLVDQLGGNIRLKQNNGTEFDIMFSSKRRYN